ncbi:unnamed protein product, partial [marine sediment metagenome]
MRLVGIDRMRDSRVMEPVKYTAVMKKRAQKMRLPSDLSMAKYAPNIARG